MDLAMKQKLEIMNLQLIENRLTAEIFTKLRPSKYFQKYDSHDIEIALKNTLYSVIILSSNTPVGMGRVIGDNRIAFFIKDIVVDSKFRNKGIGYLIMQQLMSYIELKGCDNAYVGLMSTPNKEGFYEKFGFEKRPNDKYGHGMIKFLERGNY